MIMGSEIEPRVITPSEVIAGIKSDLRRQGVPEGTKIEIHYHAAPAQAPPADVRPARDPMEPAARLVPYFVILLGGMIILGGVGALTVLLVPAIMAIVTMIAIFMGGFAVVMIAIAASIRSLRYSKRDVQMAKKRSRG